MTIAVWSIAGIGALGKIFWIGMVRRIGIWVAVYLALGWLVVVAIKPMIHSVYWVALLLLVAGGVLYPDGVIFYEQAPEVRPRHLAWPRRGRRRRPLGRPSWVIRAVNPAL